MKLSSRMWRFRALLLLFCGAYGELTSKNDRRKRNLQDGAQPAGADESPLQVSYAIESFAEGAMEDLTFSSSADSLELNVNATSDKAYTGNQALRVAYQGQIEPTVVVLELEVRNSSATPLHSIQGADYLSLWYQYEYLYLVEQEQEKEDVSLDVKFFLQTQNDDQDDKIWCEYRPSLSLMASTTNATNYQGWKELWISLIPFSWECSNMMSNYTLPLDRIRGWKLELHSGGVAQGTAVLTLDHLNAVGKGALLGNAIQRHNATSEDDKSGRNNTLLLAPNEPFQTVPPPRAYYNLSQARAIALDYAMSAQPQEPSYLRVSLVENNNIEIYHSFYELDAGESSIAIDLVWDDHKGFGNHRLDSDHLQGIKFEWAVRSSARKNHDRDKLSLGNLRAISEEDYQQYLIARDGVPQELNTSKICSVQPELLLLPDAKFEHLHNVTNLEDCCIICQEAPNCQYAMQEKDVCYYTDALRPQNIALSNSNTETHTQVFVNNRQRGDFCDVCNCEDGSDSERVVDCRGSDLTILPNQWSVDWAPRVLDLTQNPQLTTVLESELPLEYLEEVRLPANLTYLDPAVAHALPHHCEMVYEGNSDSSTPNHLQNAVVDPSEEAFSNVCCGIGESTANDELTFCNLESDYPGVDSTYEPYVKYQANNLLYEITPSSSFMFEASYSAEKCAAYCELDSNCGYFTYDNRYNVVEPTCSLMADIHPHMTHEMAEQYSDQNKTQPGYVSGQVARTRCEKENAQVVLETTASKHLVVSDLNGFEAEYTVRLGANPSRGAVWVTPRLEPTLLVENEGNDHSHHEPTVSAVENKGTDHHRHLLEEEIPTSRVHRMDKPMQHHTTADAVAADGIRVTFTPSRIVLYDNETVATVHFTISLDEDLALSPDDTLIITNDVEACDHAFATSGSCVTAEDLSVFVHVVAEGDNVNAAAIWVPIVAVAAAIFLGVCVFLYFSRKSEKTSDAFWKVDINQLRFGEPLPEVLGRGTFGLVVLAEYKGTPVAVKKVFKSEKYYGGSAMFSTFFQPSEKTVSPFESSIALDLENGLMALSNSNLDNSSNTTTGNNREKKKHKEEASMKDFIREMRQLSKLRHPCVVQLMGAVVERGMAPMIVMEYLEQNSLYDLLHNETVILENEQLVPILQDITKGMRFLHATVPKVIHGDLKAQNVLVDNKFRAKVADFGLTQKSFMGVTGSPYWLAPEVLRGEETNSTASDVYAFGILLYEMLTRKEPYEGEHFESVLLDVAYEEKRPPVLSSTAIPIQTMYLECLSEKASERPAFAVLDNRMKTIDVLNVEKPAEKEAKIGMSITLSDIFPAHIAEKLQRGDKIEPQHHDMVTIFFSDIVGFTTISQTISPLKVSDMLDRLYQRFDALSQKHEVFKVETIGDAWMGVTNLTKDQPDHVKRIARFAIDARNAAAETKIDLDDPESGFVQIRVGFHAGPVVSNIVGSRNPRFCLFGDTVNTASRMESASENGKIHCSAISAELLQQQDSELYLTARGRINIKGKGDMFTFFVSDEQPEDKSLSLSFNSRHTDGGVMDASFKELMKRQKGVSSYRGTTMPRRSKSFETSERGRRFSAYR